MSTLRTFNLQNPDSGTVNIEMDQGGNTLMTGIATYTWFSGTLVA